MSTKDRIIIPLKSQKLHQQLQQELLQDYAPIFTPQPESSSTTQSLYNKISRGGYFRPKASLGSESPVQPLNVYPNYLKRDPKEYPPMHCCPWKPSSLAENIKTIREEIPRTKNVHHTLFYEGRYANSTECPTIRSMNKTVFGRTMKTPIKMLATDSTHFEISTPEKTGTRVEILGQCEENLLQMSGASSNTRIGGPSSSNGIEPPKHSRRGSKIEGMKAQKTREKFEENQNDFKKTLVRLDAIVKKRRSWYQENKEEKIEALEKLKDGGNLLKNMDGLNHRGEIRQAVRLNAVHNHYEKNWSKFRNVSAQDKWMEKQINVTTTTRLKTLLMENKDQISRILSSTPDPVMKREATVF